MGKTSFYKEVSAYPKMLKRLPGTVTILLVSLLLNFGCSAFHEVAIVSQGEKVPVEKESVQEKESTLTQPSLLDSSPLEQEKDITASSATPNIPPIHMTPPWVSPSPELLVEEKIFAQSAMDTALPWTLQDIFFDFDQIAIRPDAIPILEQNAKVIQKRYPDRKILIQGHCDERGTEAYNFILGERRAQAVKNFLTNLGVPALSLHILSLGKSQPFCLERTISCFRQNRRAHFVLK